MIHLALNHLAFELNQYLRGAAIALEDIVVVSNPVESDGKPDKFAADKVVLFLAGVERDTLPGRASDSRALASGAPTYLNLSLMVAANFTAHRYTEALKYLSGAIAFFQQHPVFDCHSSPAMDPGIEKLILDIENLEKRELSNVWGMFGGKYMPSVLYRIRMICIEPDNITGRKHVVSAPVVSVQRGAGE